MRAEGNADSGPDCVGPELFALHEEYGRGIIGNYQKKIAACLHEMSRLDGLAQLGSRRSLPVLLLKHFQKAMELYDASTRYFLSRLQRRGVTVRCRSDCTFCCYNMPSGLSTMEFIYVYTGSYSTGIAPRLFRRCLEAQEHWSRLVHESCGDALSEHGRPLTREELLKAYQGLCIPCPFLDGTSCLIYTYRPLACRMHFSLSPPAWCNPSHFQNDYAVRFNAEPSDCVQDALDVLDDCFHLNISDIMVSGFLELTVNVMEFEPIQWK